MPVKSAVVRVYIHATEDESKVLEAVANIIPGEILKKAEVSVEEYEGHYGNPIKVVTYRVRGRLAEEVLRSILSRLSSIDRSQVRASLEDRVDSSGTLHIRLSKQEAFQGRVVLYEADDVVKIEIGFTGGRGKAIREYEDLIKGG